MNNYSLGLCGVLIIPTSTQEFSRIVLCHKIWLKTEVDEIREDKNYAG